MKISKEELTFSILSSDDDLSGFSCCEKDLEGFLKYDALDSQKNRISVTHLVYWDKILVGFYTLISDSIEVRGIQEDDGIRGYPYSRYPALKIARLATDDRFKKRNIGKNMLLKILVTAINLSHHVGCRILTVDVKPGSFGFYEKYGFTRTIRKQSDSIPMYRDFHRALIEQS
ncbi:GNAT family N-acetyltransferase [Methanospirillum stamsii]|uniref:N-acetyltransferase n=1 Tax=Methanospirillum stamsii TaxID=1277351 RepID=A0A2V2N6S1_9EURY|nr:GNAT family N-acetyltransferase [Methanospirillum stamsii]PWR75772.1 N-acetyltransferase [Methanospirillum stamsii]